MGVRRAVEMADAAIAGASSPIYTLGPLIHNPKVLASLSGRGVTIIEDCGDLPNGASVIIRAHGLSPNAEQKLRDRDVKIIDATCPRVKACQNIGYNLAEKGYYIFLAGEKDHAEIIGISGYIAAARGKPYRIVGDPEEADRAARELKESLGAETIPARCALIGQTTISADEYFSVAEAIRKYFPDLEVKKTICGATWDRQNALKELCSVADAVIIIGGRESANSRRLLAIARDCGKKAWLVESASDLPEDLLKLANKIEPVIGISAGASTPDSVIDEIEQALL